MSILEGIEDIPKHIKEWIHGNSTAQEFETTAIAFITGSYGIVLSVLKKVAAPEVQSLKTGMVTIATTTFDATTGDTVAKLAAAGAAALAEGVKLVTTDLKEAFAEIAADEMANLLHTFATSATTEAGIRATAAA